MRPGLAARALPLRSALARSRRPLAAALAAGAVVLAIGAARPAQEPLTEVLVAARDLPGGVALVAADLRTVFLPSTLTPTGVLTPSQEPLGRVPVGPVRAGEPLTDVRLLGPGLLAGLDEEGLVASTVRLEDAGTVSLLRAGDRVDLLGAAVDAPVGPDGTTAAAGPARVVAADVTVLVVPVEPEAGNAGLVVVATDSPTAARLASAAVTDRLSVVVRGSR